MDIEGLDYNTEREKLLMHEYGREVQLMVEHAITLPAKEDRQRCAEAIIDTMKRITNAGGQKNADRMQTLWNHLALLSNGRLDIDFPVNITIAGNDDFKPEPVRYTTGKVPLRHYGRAIFQLFDKLKEMEPGEERNELVRMTANQMKRCLLSYGQGAADNEKIADDLARYTDGKIQLDIDTFKFENIVLRSGPSSQQSKKKRKRR